MFISNENRKILKIENDSRTQHITIEENDTGEIKVTGVGPDLGDDVGYGWVTILDDEATTEIDPEYPNYAWANWSTHQNWYKLSWRDTSATVIFDGVIYENMLDNGDHCFGAVYNEDDDTYDWSNYPFEVSNTGLVTKDAGTHTVKVIASILKSKIPTIMVNYPFVRFTTDGTHFKCNLSFEELENLYEDSMKLGFNLIAFYYDVVMDMVRAGSTSYENSFLFVFRDYNHTGGSTIYDGGLKVLTFKPDGTITVSTIS